MDEILVKDEIKKDGINVIFDYFAVTFPFISHADDYELLLVEDIIDMITTNLGFTKEDVYKDEYAQNRYKYQYTIANGIILRLIGAELKSGYKSCMIEFKGEGCRDWEIRNPDKDWTELLEFFLVRLNGNITRVDLTIDDYVGETIRLPWIKEHLDRGNFTTCFNDKKYYVYGNDIDGWSINFGSKGSPQQLVIYEKDKEQVRRKKRCVQDFWLRYEMRFRHHKAYDLVMNIVNLKDKTLKEFAMERLYEMIDFKDEAHLTYNKSHFQKNPTDPTWLTFLDGVKKSKMTRYKIHESTYETYMEYMNPKIASFMVSRLLINNQDIFNTFTDIIDITLKNFGKVDDKKIKRINTYLKELKAKTITNEDIEDLRYKLEKEYKERTDLPFWNTMK